MKIKFTKVIEGDHIIIQRSHNSFTADKAPRSGYVVEMGGKRVFITTMVLIAALELNDGGTCEYNDGIKGEEDE